MEVLAHQKKSPEQADSWERIRRRLAAGHDLGQRESAWIMAQLANDQAPKHSLMAFLVALNAKGISAREVELLLHELYRHSTELSISGTFVDLAGTGGDRAKTVNISTMAAIVVAAAGTTVVKHGGRASSSASGTADVLEQLGVVVDLPGPAVTEVAANAGITFCSGSRFHPVLRHAAPARRELAVPTVFNILAPLANPARPRYQCLGVANVRMAPVAAAVLADRGTEGLVVRGDDGLDELTTVTTSQVWVVRKGKVRHLVIDPTTLGISQADAAEIRGGDATHNAEVVRQVLDGARGPVRDTVLLNAAAAIVATGLDDSPLSDQLAAALIHSAQAIDSGQAATTLTNWAQASQTQWNTTNGQTSA